MVRSCQLSFPGVAGPLEFQYFEASQAHIAGILNGTTYPLIPDIGSVHTILDIGGNVGAASVALAARYPNATVHAFEPGPEPRSLLVANAAAIGRIRIHPFGLHDHDDDRLAIDQLLKSSHILSQALVRQPHRGDLCYVSRDTDFARRMASMAIGKG